MQLFNDAQLQQLLQNGIDRARDHYPVVKLHTPSAKCIWLLTEVDPDDRDMAFGLCDLGLGFPELGYVYLPEIIGVCETLNLKIENDPGFRAQSPISVYAQVARQNRKIVTEQNLFGRTPPADPTPTHGV